MDFPVNWPKVMSEMEATKDAEIAALRQELESSQQDHLDTIIERDSLKQENQLLRAENANLSMAHGPGNHTDWMLTRASKYEQLHIDLEKMRQERDFASSMYLESIGQRERLTAVIEKADALVKAITEHHGISPFIYGYVNTYKEARHAG